MDTERINAFLVIAETLNFSIASEMLHKSQSVLSRQIASFENELGFELFVRDSKNVSLTRAGANMRDGLRALNEQYSALLRDSLEISEGLQGSLAVGMPLGETTEVYQQITNNFMQRFPLVNCNFVTYNISEIATQISKCELDLAFTVSTNPWFGFINLPNFRYIKIGVRHDFLYVPTTHPLADRSESELSLADFRDDVFLLLNEFEVKLEQGVTAKLFSQYGFMPKLKLCSSLTDLIAAMQNQQGVCIGSNRLFLHSLPQFKSFRLRSLLSHQEIMLWNLDNCNPCLASFIQATKSFLAEHPGMENRDVLLPESQNA